MEIIGFILFTGFIFLLGLTSGLIGVSYYIQKLNKDTDTASLK